MKVLFVASANRNGITPIVKAQGESLRRHGIEVAYYGIKGKGLRGYFSNISKLRNCILRSETDIVHAHYSLSGIVAGLAFPGRPLVVSLMGSDTRVGLLSRYMIQFTSRLFWDKVVVKSQTMKNDISVGTATVIPNGVDLSKFGLTENPSLKKEFSFSEHKPTVLFLADPLRESKNVCLARQAFQLLDPLQVNLEVRYRVPHGQVPMLLNATDVMLLTSKWEGSPNAVKEAMACNCPVVATDVGDVAWLFGDEPGHFLTGFDPADVAEKIKLALQFSKEHGKTNGRQRIIELGLDSESIAKRLISLYQSVLR